MFLMGSVSSYTIAILPHDLWVSKLREAHVPSDLQKILSYFLSHIVLSPGWFKELLTI
jgi:hypothetical protein